jgi:hypothetical protein
MASSHGARIVARASYAPVTVNLVGKGGGDTCTGRSGTRVSVTTRRARGSERTNLRASFDVVGANG